MLPRVWSTELRRARRREEKEEPPRACSSTLSPGSWPAAAVEASSLRSEVSLFSSLDKRARSRSSCAEADALGMPVPIDGGVRSVGSPDRRPAPAAARPGGWRAGCGARPTDPVTARRERGSEGMADPREWSSRADISVKHKRERSVCTLGAVKQPPVQDKSDR